VDIGPECPSVSQPMWPMGSGALLPRFGMYNGPPMQVKLAKCNDIIQSSVTTKLLSDSTEAHLLLLQQLP
jgi:hypothetical protein